MSFTPGMAEAYVRRESERATGTDDAGIEGSVENAIEARDIVLESCLRAREVVDVDLVGVICRPCARSLDRDVGEEGWRSVCDNEVRNAAEYAISS